MPHTDLLPGVTERDCAPRVVCDPRPAIRRARRRALLADVVQLALVAVVDVMMIRWPIAHVPFLTRHDSIELMIAVNVAMIAFVWLTRSFPKWSARRIAATWCAAEQSRLRPR